MIRFQYDAEHDGIAFDRRAATGQEDIIEVSKEDLLNKKHKFLTKSGGIYCILHENGQTLYVGLADRFHRRFTVGLGRHKDPCENCNNHWGHFVNPTSGSREVGMPNGNCRYFILETIVHEGNAIKQAEIDWYYIFRANGWEDESSTNEKKITNSVGMLGAKGHTAKPLYSLRLEDDSLFYSPSTIEMEERFPQLKDRIRQVLRGQSSNTGFTHRYLTSEELRLLRTNPELSALDVISDIRGVIWLDSDDMEISVSETNRISKLVWKSGRLSDDDIQVLLKRRRKTKRQDVRQSSYHGVYEHVDGKWCYHLKTHKMKPGGRQGIPVKPIEETRYGFKTDKTAAIAREKSIVNNKWQKFNDPNFDWKAPEE